MARTIQLSPGEERLKRLLLDVASSINTTQADLDEPAPDQSRRKPVLLRWAGGWVRDKLLGIETHDIDVAINCMTGEDFGQRFREFCHSPSVIEKYSISKTDLGNIHTIKANPEKSKHLATATCRIFGADVDFVNLRKETYSEESRNPEIEFGTPLEDALRRDATVNALFYNIHTDEVEDFTGGISDMNARLIRTPLDPFQTLMDDPLRVLRLVRFASRLDFTIDADVEKLMGDDRVLKSFQAKISRERVGIEIGKMLKGNRPHAALGLIDRLGLYHTIFTDPTFERMPVPDISSWHVAYGLMEALRSNNVTIKPLCHQLVQSDADAYLAWNLVALAPWESVDDPQPPAGKSKAHAVPFILRAAKEGIKAANRLCAVIASSHLHRRNILQLKQLACSEDESRNRRDLFAMAICKWDGFGGYWRLQVLYCILIEAMQELGKWPVSSDRLHSFIEEWEKFLVHLAHLDVMDAPSTKPLVDGHMLARSLGVKPGPWMAQALDVCLAWQFRHPDITDAGKVINEVRKRRLELGVPEA